jgi:tetratricopeptide (TPR) repeat protein
VTGTLDPMPIEEIRALTDRALALDPALADAVIARARINPDPRERESELLRGIALAPGSTFGHELLAEMYIEQGRNEEALAILEQGRRIDPLAPRIYMIRAIALQALGRFSESMDAQRTALRAEPRFRSALVRLGFDLYFYGELAEAIRHGEDALAIDPDAVWIRRAVAFWYAEIGDTAAMHDFDLRDSWLSEYNGAVARRDWDAAATLLGVAEELREAWLVPTMLDMLVATGTRQRVAAARARVTVRTSGASSFARINRTYLAMLDFGIAADDASRHAALQPLLAAEADLERLRGVGEFGSAVDCMLAESATLRGDLERAADLLERAFASSPPTCIVAVHRPVFSALATTVRGRALQARSTQWIAAQRALLEAMREDGRVPRRPAA